MKINFGKYRGLALANNKNKKMRPTTSVAKSVIFNSIDVQDKVVLDLFAGTGALGLESISLGAKKVTFSDKDFESVKSIKESLTKMKEEGAEHEVLKTDFRNVLRFAKEADVIFVDPPFSIAKYYDEFFKLLEKNNAFKAGLVLVLEKNKKLEIEYPANFEIIKTKDLGDNEIAFLKKI